MSDDHNTIYTESALLEKIVSEAEIVKVDHMSKQIVVKFHKPTDDFYKCIKNYGYQLIEHIYDQLQTRIHYIEVLKNPWNYVTEKEVNALMDAYYTKEAALEMAAKQYHGKQLGLHSFPYRYYNFKIEYDEGFFRFTELKDITSRDFSDIPFEFEAVVVGVDPYKDQTISEMEVGYTSDYIRYLKGMAEEPPKDVNLIKYNIHAHQFNEDIYKLLLPTGKTDVQNCLLEAPPEQSQGNISYRLDARLYTKHFVGKFMPGDNVRILGTLRETRKSKVRRGGHSHQLESWIDIIDIHHIDEKVKTTLTVDELTEYKRQAHEDPDKWLKLLRDSFVPSVHGNDAVKEGIMSAVVGASGMGDKRNEILLLVVGDPQTGKTTLTQELPKILSKCVFLNGPSSSGRGLEYSIDHERRVVTAGPLIRFKLVVLDEFDKINEKMYGELALSLENQLVTYTKAGHNISKKISCSVIALANFKSIHYDPDLSPADQISIPVYMRTRFKEIRAQNTDKDSEARTEHILKITSGDESETANLIPMDKLGALLTEMHELEPTISAAFRTRIGNYYNACEKISKHEGYIPVGPRQLLDMIRFTKARAKLLMLDQVTEKCIVDTINWFKACDKSFGIENDSGIIAGTSMKTENISKDAMFWKIFKDSYEFGTDHVKETTLCENLLSEGGNKWPTYDEARKYVSKVWDQAHLIYESSPGYLRKV